MGYRILVADDEDNIRRIIRKYAEFDGYEVEEAADGMEALEKLAWSSDQLEVLKKQMAQTRGFPEIAGGYSTTRHITNAIRHVINTKEDPRETLLNYARTINEEIRIKRKEFGLPLD